MPQSPDSSVVLIPLRTFRMIVSGCAERPVDHHRHLFGAVWRPLDGGLLDRVAWVADGDAAQALDASEEVDGLVLFVGVPVEQEMELVEGRTGDEPVVLL